MVFSSYNSTSYLPLDNDQSVTFYKNENRLFPTAIVSPTVIALPPSGRPGSSSTGSTGQADRMSSMSTTDMLTAAYEQQQQPHHHHHHHRDMIGSSAGSGNLLAGDCPFGRVQSPPAGTQQQQQQQQQPPAQYHHHRLGGAVAMCDDFQPVAYLNGPSNGYYGYVPSLVSAAARGGAAAARHHIQHGNNHNNNNNGDPEGTGNSRPLELPVAGSAGAARNVGNGCHLSSVHYHGNGAGQPTPHISCSDSERNNNNNNSDGPFGGRGEPFAPAVPLHHRKRKELSDFTANLHQQQHRDEDMDTNAQLQAASEQHHSKRRKMEPEPAPMQGMAFPGQPNSLFAAHAARDPYHPEQQQHEAIEMECQEQPHPHPTDRPSIHPEHPPAGGKYSSSGDFHPHTQLGSQPEPPYTTSISAAAGAGQHTAAAASKSKYFDSSRCMMSHMI